GIRAFFNALWSGEPVCLIIPEWFAEKPETVRFFLMQMRPSHLTGGPALYNMMLELLRTFPDLKESLRESIQTVVSSGAPFSRSTAKKISDAFGTPIHNAFGTTENQQTLNTLLCNNGAAPKPGSLGSPLPGVRVGLRKVEGDERFRLFLTSPFGHAHILGDNEQRSADGFYETGDLVKWDQSEGLVFSGRQSADFLKDGFGVKVPLVALTSHYAELIKMVEHVEWFPIKNSPGLAALLFLNDETRPEGVIEDRRVLQDYGMRASEINGQLLTRLEPFEFRHQSLSRLAAVNANAPKTGKGTVSRAQIIQAYASLIDVLEDPLKAGAGIEDINQTALEPH
ncbi:AMP-binding protein, partial [Myxococcota bacterium]|nr:AMP-binding protein [Myxococcota bacterium]